jgi:hypothetical protein
MKKGMCWSPIWPWSTKYSNGLSNSLYYALQDHPVMTFILIDIHPKDGPVWYTSEQRNFLVNYMSKRRFQFPGHRVPIAHYTHLYGFIQRRVTRADPPSPNLLPPHLRCNPFFWAYTVGQSPPEKGNYIKAHMEYKRELTACLTRV